MTVLPVCAERTASSTSSTSISPISKFTLFLRHVHVYYAMCHLQNRVLHDRNGDRKTLNAQYIYNQHKQRVCVSCAATGVQALLLYVVSLTCPQMMALDIECARHIGSLGRNHCVFGQFKTGTALTQGSAGYFWLARLHRDFQSSLRGPCNGGVLNNVCTCNIIRSVSVLA